MGLVVPVVIRAMASGDELSSAKAEHSMGHNYCECCEVYYEDLKQHLASNSHTTFATNDENYRDLDRAIAKLPSISEFVQSISKLVVSIYLFICGSFV